MLDSEPSAPGRECFLAPQAPGQRSWLNVEINAHDVQKVFPAAGVRVRRGGRKRVYDQNKEITNQILSLIKQHGTPGPNNKFLKSENALVEKAMDFSATLYKQAPARSTLQSIVRKAIGSFPERHGTGGRIG
ncbi:hypothetical protein ACFPYM_03095 [Methylobacterium hispanicum]|uniref:hypothetical protein n=1 Tax=Methylobacterium hispanicum TaxID=270350 RepID=UPI001EE0F4BD|nr:hypothetical protein [Methylobacterium hispanicum]